MLHALRLRNEIGALWIDAICINQDEGNPHEKNEQIPMMAEIYETAIEVYIWLGPSAEDSDYVMETLNSGNREAYKTPKFVAGLLALLKRPWWRRTWIAQEFILNKRNPKNFCGQAPGVSAELLLSVWKLQDVQGTVSTVTQDFASVKSLGTIFWLYNIRNSRHNPDANYLEPNLRNALLWLKGFEVWEPRDKIYAALGLIKTANRAQFVKKPGVHTKRATAEVFLDTATYLLEYEKTSTIFYDFPAGRHSGLNAPSWVPNFDLKILTTVDSIVRLGDVTSDHLDNAREDVTISEDRSTLVVRGRILDRVSRSIVVGSGMVPDWDDQDQLAMTLRMPYILHEIQNAVQQTNALAHPEQVCSEPLWKTLIAGVYGSIKHSARDDEVGCQQRFDELMAIPVADAVGLTGAELDQLPSDEPAQVLRYKYVMSVLHNFNSQPRILAMIMRTLTTGRTFFTGQVGYYGLSEPGAQDEDVIALLFADHFIPFILRACDKGYEMVGVAYIPGPLMENAIAAIKMDRDCLESFTIV